MKARTAREQMDENLIVKHFAGSHAYGTALPTSDTDFRGIFVADPVSVRTPFFRIEEVNDTSEEDTKIYELSQFVKLAVDCNPNIIETLWIDDESIVFNTPQFELMREHAPKLLSSKIAFTTSGYALSQLKRIRGHNRWLNNPQPEQKPQQVDFVSMVQHFTRVGEKATMPRDFNLRNFQTGWRLIPFGRDTYGLYNWWQTTHTPYNLETGTLNDDFENESRANFGAPRYIVKFNRQEYEDAKLRWQQYWDWRKAKTNKAQLFERLEREIAKRGLNAHCT